MQVIRISMAAPGPFAALDMSRGLRSLLLSLNLVVAGLTSSAHAQGGTAAPGPVFSDTGPDAAAYGAAAGYPAGTPATASQIEHLVNTYSHFGEMFSSRQVRRATTPGYSSGRRSRRSPTSSEPSSARSPTISAKTRPPAS